MIIALRNAAALGAAAVVLLLALWTLIPAPVLPALVVAVVAPEVSPLLALIAAGTIALAEALARGAARVVAIGVAALACGLALIPSLLVPGAVATADGEMRSALGEGWRFASSDRALALMRPAPVQFGDLLRPFASGDDVRVERNVAVAGTGLALDVYRPQRSGRHPAIVAMYGGAWEFGDRSRLSELAGYFAARDAVVAVIDYRHAPAAHWPAQIDDVRAALATIALHAKDWDIDRDRVAYIGRSAGAQLALVAASTPNALPAAAVVALYPPTDLIAGYARPPVPDPADVRDILRTLIGSAPNDASRAAYESASPVDLVHRGAPSTLLLIGDRDELVRPRFVREYAAALRAAGVRVAEIEVPWANHAFDEVPGGLGSQFARYYTERFLAATIGT